MAIALRISWNRARERADDERGGGHPRRRQRSIQSGSDHLTKAIEARVLRAAIIAHAAKRDHRLRLHGVLDDDEGGRRSLLVPGPIAEQADLARAGRELGEHHLKRGHRLVRIGIARLLGIAKIIDGLRGDAGGSRGLGRGLGRIQG